MDNPPKVLSSFCSCGVGIARGACSASGAFAQSANDIVGTWTLVSSITEQDGKKLTNSVPVPKG